MSMTDPIADFLTRIRNGIMAAHETVEIPSSKLKQEMARILTEQGYIEGFEVVPGEPGKAGDRIMVKLKYTESRESVISGLKRISRPGQRTYVDSRSMPKVLGGMGTSIISTSRGVMTGHDARRAGVGGEARRTDLVAPTPLSDMSRIGKKPIPVPTGVNVTIEPEVVRVAGPRGDLQERKNRSIEVRQEGEELLVTRPTDRAEHRALHGLTRSLIANMVTGVTEGFTKTLEIQGVGYRAVMKGSDLELALGYSHPVPIKAPQGIEFEVPAADARDHQGQLQAAGGRDRRRHPQAAAPGALQGQGHPLRGRVRRPEGR